VFILLKTLIIYAHRWTAKYSHTGQLKLSGTWSSGDLLLRWIFSVTKVYGKQKLFFSFQ